MGRPPKRAENRLGHRTKAEQSRMTTVVVQAGEVEIAEPAAHWDPIATDWYLSLAQSGTARFMEPSDWAAARYVAEVITRNLAATERFSGQLFTGVWSAMNDLLTTEAARRKVHVEVERRGSTEQAASAPNVTNLSDYGQLYG